MHPYAVGLRWLGCETRTTEGGPYNLVEFFLNKTLFGTSVVTEYGMSEPISPKNSIDIYMASSVLRKDRVDSYMSGLRN